MPAKLDRCVASVSERDDMKSRYTDPKERKSRAFAICNAALTKKGGGMEYGYLVKLDEGAKIELDDDGVPTKVNALVVGKFPHPVHGEVEITEDRLRRFASNVNDNVRGIDLDIDYDHKDKRNDAAGWVKTASVDDEGRLWYDVEWTDEARKAIKEKKYRYFSPEFMDEWEGPDGTVHSDVLFGGALTNRPFLKGLVPINFSEHVSGDQLLNIDEGIYKFNSKSNTYTVLREDPKPDHRREGNLDPKMLAEILGVEGDEDVLLKTVTELKAFKDAKTADEDQAKKFAELFPELARQQAEDRKRLSELEANNKLMEADAKVKLWSEGANAIPAKVGDKTRDFRQILSAEQAEKFDEIMGDIHADGLVEINVEDGGVPDPTDKDAVAKFAETIDKLYEDNKDKEGFTYLDAVNMAERAEPELAKAYKLANR